MKKKKKILIVGNWKLPKACIKIKQLINNIILALDDNNNNYINVVVCPPFTMIEKVVQFTKGTNIKIGAQNVHPSSHGSYTGEISAEILKKISVKYAIIGHSERRIYFKEKNHFINQKILSVVKKNIQPIICIGESIKERLNKKFLQFISNQLISALIKISKKNAKKLIIAYEPVWAIGTGNNANPELIQEVIELIKGILASHFGYNIAIKIPIIYGGSVNPSNSNKLLIKSNIDGLLIGKTSVDSANFIKIIKSTKLHF